MTDVWSENPYWIAASERLQQMRDDGVNQLVIDLSAVEKTLYNEDGPAYRALEAMRSVIEHEAEHGYRGAPRVVMALLQVLSEASTEERN